MAQKNDHGKQRLKIEGRAWTRLGLMRDLALDEATHAELGIKYNCTREAVSRFRKRHEAEIADIVARADEEFAGILITQKRNRLAMYQEQVEGAEDRKDWKLVARLLRQVAEEMGHLPSRMQISGAVDVHTSYTITGADGVPVNLANLR
jgi:hypothetical protein